MKEYVFYTSLVFLPIAAILFYILKNYQLSFFAIWLILVLTFVIIITFPVSVTKIGTIFSLVIYFVVLGSLTLYLLQYDTDYFMKTGTDTVETAEIYSEPKKEGKLEMAVTGEWKECEDMVKDEAACVGILLEEGCDGIKDSWQYNEEENEKQELGIMEKEEAYEELAQGYYYDEITGVGKKDVTVETETGYIYEGKKIMAEDKEEEGSAIIDVKPKEAVEDKKGKDADEKKVIRFLDLAFAARMKDDLKEAFVYFYKAWELTEDIDLKYMLALELAEMSIVLGWYSQGEEIIVKCMNEYSFNGIMRRELARKLTLIQLIRREIRHLKLEEMPFAKLPRLLKMKVEDELRRFYL